MRGQRLKWIRQQLKLEQSEMADILDISQSTLSRLERDDQKSFPTKHLKSFNSKFKVSEEFILNGTGEPFESGKLKSLKYHSDYEEDKALLYRIIREKEKKLEAISETLMDIEQRAKDEGIKAQISILARFAKS